MQASHQPILHLRVLAEVEQSARGHPIRRYRIALCANRIIGLRADELAAERKRGKQSHPKAFSNKLCKA